MTYSLTHLLTLFRNKKAHWQTVIFQWARIRYPSALRWRARNDTCLAVGSRLSAVIRFWPIAESRQPTAESLLLNHPLHRHANVLNVSILHAQRNDGFAKKPALRRIG